MIDSNLKNAEIISGERGVVAKIFKEGSEGDFQAREIYLLKISLLNERDWIQHRSTTLIITVTEGKVELRTRDPNFENQVEFILSGEKAELFIAKPGSWFHIAAADSRRATVMIIADQIHDPDEVSHRSDEI